ncbi:gallidermin/nisin family lantibiotic [Streptomyces celluloflavus]|uniref:gallidermin/nisin family lantibiotic n=1 Tax=Streptomyces celluloflavus TaxID=58344 RepID=UPI0036DBD7CF
MSRRTRRAFAPTPHEHLKKGKEMSDFDLDAKVVDNEAGEPAPRITSWSLCTPGCVTAAGCTTSVCTQGCHVSK